ncbi:hypothetical protein Mp_3g02040 [Marchantia polymorpha subsp. ruderalis]|uniref:Uncharacterized protein n=2 Tax=Marchantia polymorpha TaxID=3197 RepID=A0AAF6AWH6_MARPO|nr:hypothetical protein MARPO_0007s0193 [Marchantia polymorpha]BBN04110.1 hypothetical protein Mp_3g02040 [Marchantia polymorpha subsp. ruderalis]|eukprot:PTQ47797.1 hypothetical protein MARPO_0007s0193 [Marchantia polymorpha]
MAGAGEPRKERIRNTNAKKGRRRRQRGRGSARWTSQRPSYRPSFLRGGRPSRRRSRLEAKQRRAASGADVKHGGGRKAQLWSSSRSRSRWSPAGRGLDFGRCGVVWCGVRTGPRSGEEFLVCRIL